MERHLGTGLLAFAAGIAAVRRSGDTATGLALSVAVLLGVCGAEALLRMARAAPMLPVGTPRRALAFVFLCGALRAAGAVAPVPGSLSAALPRRPWPVLLRGEVKRVSQGPDLRLLTVAPQAGPTASATPFRPGCRVLVRAGPRCDALPGDRVEVAAFALPPRRASNPGAVDPLRRRRDRGLDVVLNAEHGGRVEVTARGPPFHPLRLSAVLRDRLSSFIDARLPGPGGALVAALILGRTDRLDPDLMRSLQRTGTWHLLVVSGLHVGLAAAGFAACVRRAGGGVTAAAAAALGAALLYAAVAGFRPPAVRALVAVALATGGPLLRRPLRPLHALSVAAAGLLVMDPSLVDSAGFQLSVAAVLGILRIGPAAGTVIFARRRFLRRFTSGPSARARGLEQVVPACVGAWLATTPVLAVRFGVVSPVGPLANLLLVPAAPILLCLALLALPLAAVAPSAAGAMMNGLDRSLATLTGLLASLPGAWWSVPRVPPAAATVAAALLCLAFLLSRRMPALCLCAAAGAVMAVSLPPLAPPDPRPPSLEVLDTGHGLAVLVDGGRRHVLVDGGGRGDDLGRRVLLPALRARGAIPLEAIVVSHEDVDHLSGLCEVLRNARVGTLVVGTSFGAAPAARRVVDTARRLRIPVARVAAGDRLVVGGIDVEVLQPSMAGGRDNDDSLVLRLRAGGATVLLPGDLEDRGIRSLLLSGQDLAADVLLLPHHGSPTGRLRHLLAAATGASVLIGSGGAAPGSRGDISMPRPARVLWTADEGAVRISLPP